MALPTIAYLVTRFPRTTETFIYREIDQLIASGHDVRLYAQYRDAGITQPEARRFADEVVYPPSAARSAIDLGYWLVRRPVTLMRLLGLTVWGNRRSPDFLAKGLISVMHGASLARRAQSDGVTLVHAHFATHAAVTALTVARLAGICWSTTVHAHDLYANTSMLREKLERADGVVTISRFNQERLATTHGVAESQLIRYGVDTDRYTFRPPQPVAEPWRILSVGRLNALKGHPTLVDAIAELVRAGREVDVTIVGEGPDRAELETQIARLGLADTVHLVGAVDNTEVARLLHDADCFALACDVETDGTMDGIPNSLIEAIAAGVPVVTTDVSGISELVEDGQTGLLVSHRNAAALADAITVVCSDADLRSRVVVQGRRRVEDEFDIEKTAGALERFFADLVPVGDGG